jgi:hypothetical protein
VYLHILAIRTDRSATPPQYVETATPTLDTCIAYRLDFIALVASVSAQWL